MKNMLSVDLFRHSIPTTFVHFQKHISTLAYWRKCRMPKMSKNVIRHPQTLVRCKFRSQNICLRPYRIVYVLHSTNDEYKSFSTSFVTKNNHVAQCFNFSTSFLSHYLLLPLYSNLSFLILNYNRI